MPVSLRRWLVVLLALVGVPAAILTAITTWADGWWLAGACLLAAVLAGLGVWVFLAGVRGARRRRGAGAGQRALLRARHARRCCATSTARACTTSSAPPTSSPGDAVYFTPRMVSGYRLGFGTPGDLPLSTAVQCSACLPGAFPPRVLDNAGNRRFRFDRRYDLPARGLPGDRSSASSSTTAASTTTWPTSGSRASESGPRRDGSPLTEDDAADLIVVVNAGKSAGWTAVAGRAGSSPTSPA